MPVQTPQQQQAAFSAAGLNASQVASVKSGTINQPTIDPFKPNVPQAPTPPVTGSQTAQNAATAANQANAGKPGYDVFGKPTGTGGEDIQTARTNGGTYTGVDGQTYYNYDHTPTSAPPPNAPTTSGTSTTGTDSGTTSSSGTSTTGTDTSSSDTSTDPNVAKEAAAEAQRTADANAAAAADKQFGDAITNIQNGTTPLTAGEQAQIDGLTAQYKTMIDTQTLMNTNATGTANIRGYQTGAAEYDPTFQQKTIASVAAAGAQKVAALQSELATTVSQLTEAFHNNDIAAIKDTMAAYDAAYTKSSDALQKTITDTQAAIKNAQDQAAASQAEADKQATYALDVAKFQQTGDQNSFDNALKTEQEKFDEQNKTATLALTASNDKANQAIAAFKAGMGAGGGNPINVPAASMSATGNPDPVSQKAVLDQITQQYGPMTATAIQSLADYTMNPTDWSSRAGSAGMNREQAVALAKQYDPTYNDANYSIRAAYMKSIASSQSGTIGAAVRSANTSINHLTDFANQMAKITAPEASVNGTRNLQSINQAKTYALGVSDELAKFFKGTGSSDVGSISSWQSQINPDAVLPGQVHGSVQGAIDLMEGQLSSLSDQYTNTMGKAPTSNFLSPAAISSLSTLKNQGYNINIPGVNYSDKNAYLANGGSPDALTKAYQTLTNANDPNNPPTPENVLELAQIQGQ